VWLNQGAGLFGRSAQYVTGAGVFGLDAADFNGDCFPDVLQGAAFLLPLDCTRPGGTSLYLSLNRGDGTFSPPIAIETGLTILGSIAAYESTGASLSSIAVSDWCSSPLELLPNVTSH
jgi:hypothetical protein